VQRVRLQVLLPVQQFEPRTVNTTVMTSHTFITLLLNIGLYPSSSLYIHHLQHAPCFIKCLIYYPFVKLHVRRSLQQLCNSWRLHTGWLVLIANFFVWAYDVKQYSLIYHANIHIKVTCNSLIFFCNCATRFCSLSSFPFKLFISLSFLKNKSGNLTI